MNQKENTMSILNDEFALCAICATISVDTSEARVAKTSCGRKPNDGLSVIVIDFNNNSYNVHNTKISKLLSIE